MAPGAGAGGQPLLLPDLVTLRISQGDLVLQPVGNKLFLRFANEVGNTGRGPLELYPSADSNDCDGDGNPANDRDAYQRIFLDSNGDDVFHRGQDVSSAGFLVGCQRYHPRHNHWHLLNFARYKLVRQSTGRTVALSTKIGFCIIDQDRRFPSLPGSPQQGYYPAGSADCYADTIDGISIGWTDTYRPFTPGQVINVTGLPRGRYCLVSTTDPDKLLREFANSNNARGAPIVLRPDKPAVERLPGNCSK
jgi:Lysyl oxidase